MKLDIEKRVKDKGQSLSTLNNHHLNFFKIINLLTNAIDNKEEGPFKFYYNELVDYIDDQFDEQENYLKRVAHVRTEEHCSLHRIFSQGMARLLVKIDEEGMSDSNVKKCRFIVEELINHIMITDQKI